MSEIVKIENHVEQALDRRLEQYIGKENLQAIIEIHAQGWQDLEDVFIDMMTRKLNIYEAFGATLDNIGRIVGQPRLGYNDDFYRILILARIGINVSNGDGERIINTAKLLTSAPFIHYMNLRGAEIAIGTDGDISTLSVQFLLLNLQKVVMGGVRLNYISHYSPDDAFSVDGPNQKTIGKGLGTIDDNTVGGKLATIYTIKNKFSLAGNNTSDSGLGSIYDPLVGGVLT